MEKKQKRRVTFHDIEFEPQKVLDSQETAPEVQDSEDRENHFSEDYEKEVPQKIILPRRSRRRRSSTRRYSSFGQFDGANVPIKVPTVLLFVINVIFWASGITLVAVGFLSFFGEHEIYRLAKTNYNYNIAGPAIISVGCGSMLLSCFGCATEHRKEKLLWFMIISGIFFIVQMMAAVMYAMEKGNTDYYFESLSTTYHDEYWKVLPKRLTIDKLQQSLECCGLQSFRDWFVPSINNVTSLNVSNLLPISCCSPQLMPYCHRNVTLWNSRVHPYGVFPVGCLPLFRKWMREFINIASAVCITVCITQFIGLSISIAIYIVVYGQTKR